MPELPDVTVYVEALERRITGGALERIRIAGPSLLRSVDPPYRTAEGKRVVDVLRIGKRIAIELEDELFVVLHLMIAGRLHWRPPGAPIQRKVGLAGFDFPGGTLLLTEAGTRKRASMHVVQGESRLRDLDAGGLEVLGSDLAAFREALLRENHTIKRALTDPRLLSGIGNAYSDEILHRARLSPVRLARRLSEDELERLHRATTDVLREWIDRLRTQAGNGFPEKVTAFRAEMAVHGRYGKACPACGTAVQRIVYAENECNYCPRCQTGGKLLADRALSRLLHGDWPKTLEELEERRTTRQRSGADMCRAGRGVRGVSEERSSRSERAPHGPPE
ncbi:MAG: formamidopyrimidine-DNA glycosylase [Candidatus Binatota bacterium]|nr:formamidopyrimidine-DNA glycosylase [Candidatus Binatota bacterium]